MTKYLLFFTTIIFQINYAGQWLEKAKLYPDDGHANALFGQAVSLSGDYAIIGAINDAHGSAYIFKREGEDWYRVERLMPEYYGEWNIFGWSVSISEDHALVGSPFDIMFPDTGRVHVYKRGNDNWIEMQEIRGYQKIGFGESLNIFNDYILIKDNSDSGDVVNIYQRNDELWEQIQILISSDHNQYDKFGGSIRMFDDFILVGNYYKNNQRGCAYLFKKNGTDWTEQQILTPDGAEENDHYGLSIGLSNEYAFIGGYRYNYDISDSSDMVPVYVYKRNGDSWEESQQLIPEDVNAYDHFGAEIALTDSFALISASGYNNSQGAVYVYKRTGDHWEQVDKLMASDGEKGGHFGSSISISGDYVIIGASGDDDKGSGSGAAYIFKYETSSSINPSDNIETIDDFHLFQNYPNPFNPATTIKFYLSTTEEVSILIYNIQGQLIKSLLHNNIKTKGSHTVQWNGRDMLGKNVSTGVYLYQIQTANQMKTKKMILIR